MALETAAPRSRRTILTAALGGLAATAVAALDRPGLTLASNGQAILLGTKPSAPLDGTGANEATAGTEIYATNEFGLKATGPGAGLHGHSATSFGVYGTTASGVGIRGESLATNRPAIQGISGGNSTAVFGYSGTSATPGPPAKTGLFGYANQDTAARGVLGRTTIGQGVRGEATTGVGLQGVATTGAALAVAGRATFSRSGRTSIPINQSYVDVTVPGGLLSAANVLATLQAYRSGVYVAAVRTNYPSAGKARIYLNKVASTSVTTPVAWFVIG